MMNRNFPRQRASNREMPHPVVAPGLLKPKVKEAGEEARSQGFKYAVMLTEDAHLYCCYCGAVSPVQTKKFIDVDVHVNVYVGYDLHILSDAWLGIHVLSCF